MMKSLIAEVRFIDKTLIYGIGTFWSLFLTNYKLITNVEIFNLMLLLPIIITLLLGSKTYVLLYDYFDLKEKNKKHMGEERFDSCSIRLCVKKWALFTLLYVGINIINIYLYFNSDSLYLNLFAK